MKLNLFEFLYMPFALSAYVPRAYQIIASYCDSCWHRSENSSADIYPPLQSSNSNSVCMSFAVIREKIYHSACQQWQANAESCRINCHISTSVQELCVLSFVCMCVCVCHFSSFIAQANSSAKRLKLRAAQPKSLTEPKLATKPAMAVILQLAH